MNYDWISDPNVFKVGCEDVKASLRYYRSKDELLNNKSSYVMSLNGMWKFDYVEGLDDIKKDFYKEDYDCNMWDDICVPGHIQMQGYGVPMYVNQVYPWSSYENIKPGEIPKHNPVGSYVTFFKKSELMEGNRVLIQFDGVESAFALWLNGCFIGYSEDSFTPTSFDITSYLKEENKLALQVFKYSSGSWLEDQDFYRFSGIFRDVNLYIIPDVHLSDLKVNTLLSDNYNKAAIRIKSELIVSGEYDGEMILTYQDEIIDRKNMEDDVVFYINNPYLWSSENPYLYDLYIVLKKNNEVVEIVKQHIGIREFKIINGIMCINGKRIVFHGVNRHEFSAYSGRVVSEEMTYNDLMVMKDNNINAVRTSHYPNQTFFYDLCDELGLYVIDEVNLETHGTWSELFDKDMILPHDKMEWYDAIIDRTNSMYQRDKNHPSIVIWSLGNESYGGRVLYEQSQFLRALDNTRVIHYEGISHDRSYPDTSDIESQMYTYVSDIKNYLNCHHDKPFILCEYAHSMGNSNGALHKYIALEKEYEQYQGGFIWDFVDQAIYKDGKMHYGGDFREGVSDYDFCGNGLLFADRVLTPKMQEVKYCYQYVDIDIDERNIKIKNNYLFTTINKCEYVILKDGYEIYRHNIDINIKPLETLTILNPYQIADYKHEYAITINIYNGDKICAYEQYVYPYNYIEEHRSGSLQLVEDYLNIGIVGNDFHVSFCKNKGLVSYQYHNEEYIRIPPRPQFFRPSTNNDIENQYGLRHGIWLSASLYARIHFKYVKQFNDYIEVVFEYELPKQLKENRVEMLYKIYGDGEIAIDMDYQACVDNPRMSAFGLVFQLYKELDCVDYYGLGEYENYEDRKSGALLKRYSYNAINNMTPYLYPQECGLRTGIREMLISNKDRGLMFKGLFQASALPYTLLEIENARHQDEFPIPYQTVVSIYEKQMGVGGDDTWGARTHDEYLLEQNKHHLHISMKGWNK